MTRVLVLGQPYWASLLAQALNSPTADMSASFVGPRGYAPLLARIPRSERVVIMRAGFRVGATTPRGRLFDAYWHALCRMFPGAVRCHYWFGTDVLNTVQGAQAGALRWRALLSTRDDLHIAVTPWLAAELATVGLTAYTAHLPVKYQSPETAPALPAEFSVLTYLPADRFGFYGGETIIEAARRLPHVRFDVVGYRGRLAPAAPANVLWHGWVNMAEFYANATVIARIPRHDGLGGTAVEGLLNARHVLYTYDLPFVRHLQPATVEVLVAVLAELRDLHDAGGLGLNSAGRAYALEAFDQAKMLDDLATLIRART